MDPASLYALAQRARAPLLALRGGRAAAAHRSLAPGLAGRGLRRRRRRPGTTPPLRGRQVGPRASPRPSGCARGSPGCWATRAAASRSAPNTHELVVRLLSALPLRARPRLVTTDGEFHTIRRQLDRLAEEGLEVVRVPEAAARVAGGRLGARGRRPHRAGAGLGRLLRHRPHRPRARRGGGGCRRHGAALLVDAYHALNVVRSRWRGRGSTTRSSSAAATSTASSARATASCGSRRTPSCGRW